MSDTGPLAYGKAGSWEAFASGYGIAQLAHMRNPAEFPADVSPSAVIQRALASDPAALAVVNEAGEWLGKGLALLVDILNPEVIIIGTLGVVLGDLVLEPARRVMRQEALPVAAAACRVVPAQLGTKLMDMGCLMAACNAFRSGRLTP
jgi:glucokinase